MSFKDYQNNMRKTHNEVKNFKGVELAIKVKQRPLKPQKPVKKLVKTARSRTKKCDKPQKNYGIVCNNQRVCKCDECVENRISYVEQRTCECCGLEGDNVEHYNSIHSSKGTKMCPTCAKSECCPNCKWDSGGSYCKYCRQSSSW
jgi:hypothetical protein